MIKKTLLSVFFIACNFLSAAYSLPASCPKLSQLSDKQIKSAFVDWLPDGDTIHTTDGQKLRLLHINTPEINPTTSKPAEAFALEAKSQLRELIGQSKKIYWINDIRVTDKYHRELALVFNHQGILINANLVAQGLAHTLILVPNQVYWQCFSEVQRSARKLRHGIWNTTQFTPQLAKNIQPKRKFQLVSGTITQIKNSRKNRWLVLDNELFVSISHKNRNRYTQFNKYFKVGENITLQGYIYRAQGQLRMRLTHPSMHLTK